MHRFTGNGEGRNVRRKAVAIGAWAYPKVAIRLIGNGSPAAVWPPAADRVTARNR